MSDSLEIHLSSSANDVWTAITCATVVFPRAMPSLYESIQPTKRDGCTSGSVRTITFGDIYDCVVETGAEEITDVDQAKMAVKSSFVHDGGLVPTLFDSLDMTVTVLPLANDVREPGCGVRWEFEYTGFNGDANVNGFKRVIEKAYEGLDVYIRMPGVHMRGLGLGETGAIEIS